MTLPICDDESAAGSSLHDALANHQDWLHRKRIGQSGEWLPVVVVREDQRSCSGSDPRRPDDH